LHCGGDFSRLLYVKQRLATATGVNAVNDRYPGIVNNSFHEARRVGKTVMQVRMATCGSKAMAGSRTELYGMVSVAVQAVPISLLFPVQGQFWVLVGDLVAHLGFVTLLLKK
jgi:hypothetical protein